MICRVCGIAGDLMQYRPEIPDTGYKDCFTLTSEILHSQCKGGTWCDCQHMPTSPSMISQETEEARRRGR